MINLFKRVYVNYDTDLRCSLRQKRIIVSDRKFPNPITTRPAEQALVGILEFHTTKEEFFDRHDGLEGVLYNLFSTSEKVCLITTHELATLVTMSVFKSIVKNPTVEAAFTYYRSIYAHERKMVIHQLGNYDNDYQFRGEFPVQFTLEQFQVIYDEAIAVDALRAMEPREMPIELLMATYFANPTLGDKRGNAFLKKFRDIAFENSIFQIRTARIEILTDSIPASVFLGEEVDEIEATARLMTHPATAWLGDESFVLYSEVDILKKYSFMKLLRIYETIEKLTRCEYDEKSVLQYLARGDVAGLVELDAEDMKGNFIGTEQFISKVNGVFINKCYQEKRAVNISFFQQFEVVGN